jgi:hypothetical protein
MNHAYTLPKLNTPNIIKKLTPFKKMLNKPKNHREKALIKI